MILLLVYLLFSDLLLGIGIPFTYKFLSTGKTIQPVIKLNLYIYFSNFYLFCLLFQGVVLKNVNITLLNNNIKFMFNFVYHDIESVSIKQMAWYLFDKHFFDIHQFGLFD